MKTARMATALVYAALLAGPALAGQPSTSGNSSNTPTPPVIVDATNKVVGLAVNAPPNGNGGVIIKIGGAQVFVPVEAVPLSTNVYDGNSPTQLRWSTTTNQYLSYASGDCSGAPSIVSIPGYNLQSPWRPSVTVRTGNTAMLYVASTANPTTQMLSSNNSYYPYFLQTCNVYAAPGPFPVFAIQTTLDLTQTYPEPLHVQ